MNRTPLPEHIRTEVQRILDSAARRILAERERETLSTTTGTDRDLRNQGLNKGTFLVKGETIPVERRLEPESGEAVA